METTPALKESLKSTHEAVEYATALAVEEILKGEDPFGFAARIAAEYMRVAGTGLNGADLFEEAMVKHGGDTAAAVAACSTVLAAVRINKAVELIKDEIAADPGKFAAGVKVES